MAASRFDRFWNAFRNKTGNVIGMIHLRALPGTPCCQNSMKELIDIACNEAAIYKRAGLREQALEQLLPKRLLVFGPALRPGVALALDGLIVENMHDVPYVQASQMGPEVVSVMSVVCREVKRIFSHAPVGVQVLAGANREAIAIAKAAGLQFVRAEGFVFSHVADEGMMNACAGDLMRYRRHIDADEVLVFTDVKKKHSSHSITSDLDIVSTAQAAEFFLSDGVVVTGNSTGQAASLAEVKAVIGGVHLPVLVGSGVTVENYHLYRQAHAVVVGSHFKTMGHWAEELNEGRVTAFMSKVKEVRKTPVESTMIM